MSSEDVTELLRACLPERKLRTVEFLAEGDFCRAYLLNGQDVVRIPKHEHATRALAREACLLPRIAPGLSVTIPVPVYVPCPGSAGGSFTVHKHITGVALTLERWNALPDPARAGIARQVGHFLEELHALDVAVALSCDVEIIDYRSQAARLDQKLRSRPGTLLPASLRKGLDLVFRRYLDGQEEWNYQPVILHADVSPGHVLVDMEHPEITGVIDWGDVRIGDPARDFIFLYEDWGSEFLGMALEGYGLEHKERFLPRVHLKYLMDQLEWTFHAGENGKSRDLEHGIRALLAGLRDFEQSVA